MLHIKSEDKAVSSCYCPYFGWQNNLVFAAILLYPFMGIWQWGDLTDLGYHMMEVQNFFGRIDEGKLTSPRLLSYLIGAIWWKSLGGAGILGMLAFASFLIVIGSIAVIYTLTRISDQTTEILIATLAAEMFYVRNWLLFDYDVVSLVFSLWAAAFVIISLKKGSLIEIFIAGIFMALATAARTPSIVLLSFITLPFLNHQLAAYDLHQQACEYNDQCKIKKAFLQAASLIAGFTVLILILSVILITSGYFKYFLKGFEPFVAAKLTVGSKGGYGMSALCSGYLYEIKQLFPYVIFGISWLMIGIYLFKNSVSYYIKASFGILSVGVVCIWVINGNGMGYGHAIKYLVLGFYFTTAVLILSNVIYVERNLRIATAAGCFLCISTFAGSSVGLLKTSGGLMFLVPACTVALINTSSFKIKKDLGWRSMAILSVFVLIAASITVRAIQIYPNFNSPLCRYHFLYTVKNIPSLCGLWTSKDLAQYLSSVIPDLKSRIGKESVFVYGHTPLIYAMLEKDSYLPEIWFGNNVFSVDTVISRMKYKIDKTGNYPSIFVTEKKSLGEDSWERMRDYLTINKYKCIYSYNNENRPYDGELWQRVP